MTTGKDILQREVKVGDCIIVAHPNIRKNILLADVTRVTPFWVYWEGVDVRGRPVAGCNKFTNVCLLGG